MKNSTFIIYEYISSKYIITKLYFIVVFICIEIKHNIQQKYIYIFFLTTSQ